MRLAYVLHARRMRIDNFRSTILRGLDAEEEKSLSRLSWLHGLGLRRLGKNSEGLVSTQAAGSLIYSHYWAEGAEGRHDEIDQSRDDESCRLFSTSARRPSVQRYAYSEVNTTLNEYCCGDSEGRRVNYAVEFNALMFPRDPRHYAVV
jgi:hypothetical protein